MARIRPLMAGRQGKEIDFGRCLPAVTTNDPYLELRARSAVASSLVAVLEMARAGKVVVTQAETYAPIRLTDRA